MKKLTLSVALAYFAFSAAVSAQAVFAQIKANPADTSKILTPLVNKIEKFSTLKTVEAEDAVAKGDDRALIFADYMTTDNIYIDPHDIETYCANEANDNPITIILLALMHINRDFTGIKQVIEIATVPVNAIHSKFKDAPQAFMQRNRLFIKGIGVDFAPDHEIWWQPITCVYTREAADYIEKLRLAKLNALTSVQFFNLGTSTSQS